MQPRVIVLILSYNGKSLLEEAVNSYLANDYPRFEVIVIDNGSNDGTREYVHNSWSNVKVIRTEKNLGYSGGLNFGMDYAFNQEMADFVLISNNDVKADDRLIGELVKVGMQDPKIGFVTGKVYDYESPNVLQTVGKVENQDTGLVKHLGRREVDKGQYEEVQQLPTAEDVFMLVSKGVYFETGGYDLNFRFQSEQWDWHERAKKKGFKVYYTPYAKLWHKEGMTIGKISPMHVFYDSRNVMLVILIHKTTRQLKKYLKLKYKMLLVSSVKYIVKGKFKLFFSMWAGFLSAVFWGLRHKKLKFSRLI